MEVSNFLKFEALLKLLICDSIYNIPYKVYIFRFTPPRHNISSTRTYRQILLIVSLDMQIKRVAILNWTSGTFAHEL